MCRSMYVSFHFSFYFSKPLDKPKHLYLLCTTKYFLKMKNEQDYIQDIAEIRSMMERSSRFLSLSGWAGVMAGLYALAGAYVAVAVFHFDPEGRSAAGDLADVILL